MSKFVVFAVLAACAFALPMFPDLKERRDGKYTLTPHELPCAYEINFNQITTITTQGETHQIGTATGAFNVHDSYFKYWAKSVSPFIAEFNATRQILLRSDLKGEENNTVIGFDSVINVTYDKCPNFTITEDQRKALANHYLEPFVTNTTWNKKTYEMFGGKNCSVYIDEEQENITIKLYVDSDNYIVGVKVIEIVDIPSYSSSVSPSSSAHSSSTHSSSAHSSVSPSSSAHSSVSPSSSAHSSSTHSSSAHSSSAHSSSAHSSSTHSSSTHSSSAHSSSSHSSASKSSASKSSASNSQNVRDDGSSSNSTSSNSTASSTGSKSTSTSQSASSTVSSSSTPVPTENVLEMTTTVTYKNYAPLADFALSKELGDKCLDIAYTAPKDELCPAPSVSSSSVAPVPSQHSSASTTVVAVVMTLLCVVIALL